MMEKITRKEVVFGFCVMLTVASLLISNTTASKMYDIYIGDFHVLVPVGTSLFCLSFLATDVVSEVWGRSHAIAVALIGLFARILGASFYLLAVFIPGTESWDNQEAYASVLGASSRILFAGIVAFFVASILDAYIYHYFKERHEGKNLMFVRNLISTIFAQSIGAILFCFIAFAGVIPNDKILIIAIGNMMIKWFVAVLDTPLVYIFRNFAEGKPLLNFKG